MNSAEFKILSKMIADLHNEVRSIKNGVDVKIDNVSKTVMDAFKGFGILDADEDTWSETQVCERYCISRRTMYSYRSKGIIPYIKGGESNNSAVRYRKADVIEFFAAKNA